MSAPFVTPSWISRRTERFVAGRVGFFPKTRRLLRPAEFRAVYDQGFKVTTGCFVAFCWRSPGVSGADDGPRVGFTTPRALGKAVLRNRMRRRLREAVRTRLPELGPGWRIVWNLRRGTLSVPHSQLVTEVEKVLARCSA
jgi:ribonuclease P protein component